MPILPIHNRKWGGAVSFLFFFLQERLTAKTERENLQRLFSSSTQKRYAFSGNSRISRPS